ncbi:MAG TPA: cysteine hydrolase [Clostridiaceae bacterium]|nr:cysteine hydrolase [Clostridiaceae bacterium]
MKKLLIVVDYQNDFVDGALGFPGAADIFPAIRKKVIAYKNEGHTVVFTKDTHVPEYLDTQEGRNLPIIHCVKGTQGHELYGDLEVLSEGSKVFEKNTFGSDLLFDYLRSETFESVELVGLVSNICVLSNAVLAKTASPETPIIVDALSTAGNDPELHEKALDVLKGIQVQVINR